MRCDVCNVAMKGDVTMRTIQDIERLDLTKLDKAIRVKIRHDLDRDYHHTSSDRLLSDGRNAKEVIGKELNRFRDYALGLTQ